MLEHTDFFHPRFVARPFGGSPEHRILIDDLDLPPRDRAMSWDTLRDDDRRQETHHRIKNGLQLIASLLNLQAREAEAAGASEQLKEAAGRVAAVARLHEHLQRSNAERVDVGDLLFDVCTELARSAGCDRRGIRFDLALDGGEQPGDRASSLALIVNELATNCLKHAYADRGGVVAVRLERQGSRYRLSVADDGPGFPAAGSRPGGLGLTLVEQLARSLGGRVVVEPTRNGACVAVEFG
ncbi:MAG TPA: sensor histidine kinase [Caulobacteraceae bacterium]|jgi:two-component sensor histidine kinase|nr:sensor histidine kinase [Caulobacteraceae bacterium]